MRQYRIIQRGNNRFYAQYKALWFWRDLNCESGRTQSEAMRHIERQKAEDQRIQEYKTIKKVIEV